MKIADMNIVKLRKALIERGLPSAGTKGDLELRLRQDLLDNGEDSNNFEFEQSDNEVSAMFAKLSDQMEAQSEQLKAQSVKMAEKLEAQSNELKDKIERELKTLNDSLNQQFMSEVKRIDKDLGKLKQNTENQITNVVSKLDSLSENMSKIGEEIDTKIELAIHGLEDRLRVADPKQAPNTNIINQAELPVGLIADPKVIKDSLPEFHGRLEEDPKLFLANSLSLLKRTTLPINIYTQILAQQLRGQAATWWQNIKGLGLDWEEFKKELCARFDSDGVKAAVNRKFLTEAQPTGMRAGAFIIQKYQLFKRLHPDEDSSSSLPYIIELLSDKIRPLVRVANPKSFNELREVIRQLEEEYKSKTSDESSTNRDVNQRRCYKCGKTGHVRDRCPEN